MTTTLDYEIQYNHARIHTPPMWHRYWITELDDRYATKERDMLHLLKAQL